MSDRSSFCRSDSDADCELACFSISCRSISHQSLLVRWLTYPRDQLAYAFDFASDLAHLFPPLLLTITDMLDCSLYFLDDEVDSLPIGVEALLQSVGLRLQLRKQLGSLIVLFGQGRRRILESGR